MAISSDHLIDAAVRLNLIEPEILAQLRIDARRKRVDLVDTVTAHYRLPISALYQAAAELRGLSFINPIAVSAPSASLLKKVPQALARRKLVLPLFEDEQGVLVATSDPDDRATLETLQRLLGQRIRVAMAEPDAMHAAIGRYLNDPAQNLASVETLAETDLIAMLNDILKEAYLRRASDVHMAQEESGLRVRLRVDGKLQDYFTNADGAVANGLISRVKVLADLDIAEQREPQDGGMTYYLAPPIDTEFNIRVATAPTRLGERVTMRLLGQEAQSLTLPRLGMSEHDMLEFRKAIRKPFGMILLTGPTGSGKSTTLFAALQEINHPELNIMTVENPIEYVMDGISQIQTGPKISFASALRSLLRHDPDVLMVGEIRDEETADVALKAAMTGHLVFSTLHTNTAAGTVGRLVDIGCEPYLIGSTMNAVIAQRLVRRLCPHCRKPRAATKDESELLGQGGSDVVVFEPVGCAACQGRGYRGRLGLFETLWFDEALSKLVSSGCSEDELERHALADGKLNLMWADGSVKVLAGDTSLSELQTVAVKRH
ncbi:Type II secretion system protein E [Methylophilaceae bacterium]|nr:Type II secretion system protein E [Methylophilaceae bacterium]